MSEPGATSEGAGVAAQTQPSRDESRRRVALLVFVACFLVYAPFHRGHFTGTDEVGVFEMTRSLAAGRGLTVPRIMHSEIGRGGERYSYFSVAQAFLALPLYALGSGVEAAVSERTAAILAGEPIVVRGHQYRGSVQHVFVLLYAPLSTAALVALVLLLQLELGVSLRSALLVCGLTATCTYVAVMSSFFLRHGTEAIGMIGALLFMLRYRETGRLGALALGCAFAVSIPLVRMPASVAALGLGGYLVYVLWTRTGGLRERAQLPGVVAAVLLPALAGLLLHMAINHAKWGSLLESPMVGQRAEFDNPLWVGVAGYLLSPGCSIFVYSPLLLMLPAALPVFWRRHRAEAITFLVLVTSFVLFNARFDRWSGLWSAPGPRYVFIAAPLLMVPLGVWLDRSTWRYRLAPVALLGAAGGVLQLALLSVRWGAVPAIAGWPIREPDKADFLFRATESPPWVIVRLFFEGAPLDPWLLRLWRGWPGFEGAPAAVALIASVWVLAFGYVLVRLARIWREAGEAGRG